MPEAEVRIRARGPAARVEMRWPEKRNALSVAMMERLAAALGEAGRRPGDAGGGAGRGGAGVLRRALPPEMVGSGPAEQRRVFAACSDLMAVIRELAQPVIAEVRGIATRRRLPVGRRLRPGGRRRDRPLRHPRGADRALLLDSDGPAEPRGGPETGAGNAAHRRLRGRPDRARMGPREPGRARGGSGADQPGVRGTDRRSEPVRGRPRETRLPPPGGPPGPGRLPGDVRGDCAATPWSPTRRRGCAPSSNGAGRTGPSPRRPPGRTGTSRKTPPGNALRPARIADRPQPVSRSR